jgi:hypothetical protein
MGITKTILSKQIVDNAYKQMGHITGKHVLNPNETIIQEVNLVFVDLITEIIDTEALTIHELTSTIRTFMDMINSSIHNSCVNELGLETACEDPRDYPEEQTGED